MIETNNPRKVCLLMTAGPDQGRMARERLDIVLMALALEQTVSVVFLDDGVYQLLPEMSDADGKRILKMVRSLPLFDVAGIYVETESLAQRQLSEADSVATEIARSDLTALIAQQDLLL